MKDVIEGAAYEFRVSAINLSGAGDPSIPCDKVIARDPKSKPAMLTFDCGATKLLTLTLQYVLFCYCYFQNVQAKLPN